MSATNRRPFGITVLAVLGFLSGLITILFALPSLGVDGFLLTPHGQQAVQAYGNQTIPFFAIGVGFVVVGVISLICGVGALRLRSWAWPFGLGMQGLVVVFSLLEWIQGGYSSLDVLNVVLAVAIMANLFLPGIRAAFSE